MALRYWLIISALVAGVFSLAALYQDRALWRWHLASGLVAVIAGGYIVSSPFMGTAIVVGFVTILLGVCGMIVGVADIMKAAQGAGWPVRILGILSLVVGASIALDFTSFMASLPWVWGALAVGAGAVGIAGSLQLKKAQDA